MKIKLMNLSKYQRKEKNGKNIESLIRLNEARKKMRSSLGMDLQISTEKAMENYWTLGDFLNQGD